LNGAWHEGRLMFWTGLMF